MITDQLCSGPHLKPGLMQRAAEDSHPETHGCRQRGLGLDAITGRPALLPLPARNAGWPRSVLTSIANEFRAVIYMEGLQWLL